LRFQLEGLNEKNMLEESHLALNVTKCINTNNHEKQKARPLVQTLFYKSVIFLRICNSIGLY